MDIFDNERTGTGTNEWAETTLNISKGCSNGCLYCYAAHNANRFKTKERADWTNEELTKMAHITSYPAKGGVVMFPSSHDITMFNLKEYLRVARLVLSRGNNLLIVSKPRMNCIEHLVDDLWEFRDQILFRFTIGTMIQYVSKFWEPGAPDPNDRRDCLEMAYDNCFRTSVSIEPMLQGKEDTVRLVDWVSPLVTDTIWIGKMNKARLRVPAEHHHAVAEVEKMQSDEQILALYEELKGNEKVRWKDSIRDVVARNRAQ